VCSSIARLPDHTAGRAAPAGSAHPNAGLPAGSALTRGSTAIFATALAVRLVHIWQIRRAPFFTVLLGDSRAYDAWAQRIAAGDWIGHEVFYQAPLYPYFLAAIYAVAGRSLLLVRVAQATIGSASCVLLGLAVQRLLSARAGLAAGLMLALYAPAIFFDGLIQKSVLDVFFICLALHLIARTISAPVKADTVDTGHRRRAADWNWLALGLAIGGLSLTRENAIVFTIVLAAWAASHAPRAAATFLAGAAIVLLPVAARNSLVGGGFYVTTSQFGPNFYIGNNPQSDGAYQSLRFGRGAPEYERQDATEIAERALGRRLTPAEVSGYWTDRALDFITSRPGAWLKLVARKAALLVNATEMLDSESQESHAEWSVPLRMASIVGHFGVLVPLAAFGMMVMWPNRSRLAIVYALPAAYAASVLLFYVFARYRYPLVPFLVLFAAATVTRGRPGGADQAGHRGRRQITAAVAVLGPVAMIANWPLLSAEMNRAVTEHNLGAALQSDGRLDDALAHYRRAIAIRPDYAPAYNNLASTLRAKGRLDEAVAGFGRALELRPDYPEAHYNLGNALLESGRPNDAATHFQVAMQSMPVAADVHNNLGIALAARGQLAAAVEHFRQTLAIEPDSVKAHRNLGDALMTLGARQEALDHLERAAQLAPFDAAIQYDFGSALLEAGRLDEAVAAFRVAIRLAPGSVEAHNNLGIALGSQGKFDQAIAEFQTALRIKPDFTDAQRNLAVARAARR
jgi:tetratricopeptide (TPR) repeat protein